MEKEPRIKFSKSIAIIAIAILIVAGGFFGQPWFAAHQAAARRNAFIQSAAPANTLYAEGKFEQAIPALQKILAAPAAEMSPELIAVYNNLATAQIAQGHLAGAQKTLNQAKAKLDALTPAEIAKPEYRREQVRMLTGIANILMAGGKLKEAQRLYQQAVALTPEDAVAHANLANAFFIQGGAKDAENEFERAHALQPNNPETLDNWGILLLNVKRPWEAEQKFRDALKLNPKGAKYYYGLGLALRAQDRLGPALQAQQTAIFCNPNMIEAFLEMGDLYFQVKDYRLSEIYLRGAMKLDPNNMQAILALARLLAETNDLSQRDYLESASLFQKAVDLTKGKDVNLLTQLSDMYALEGSFERSSGDSDSAAAAFDRSDDIMKTAMEQGEKQHLAGIDMEVLRQHELAHFFLRHPSGPPTPTNPLSSVGELFGMNAKPPDPYDNPESETPEPIVPHPIALPFTIEPVHKPK